MLYAIDVQGLGLKRCRKVVQAEKAPNGTSIGTSNGTSGTMVGVFQRIFQRILEIKLVLPEQNDMISWLRRMVPRKMPLEVFSITGKPLCAVAFKTWGQV